MKTNGIFAFSAAFCALLFLASCSDSSSSGPNGDPEPGLSSVEGSSDAGSSGGNSGEGSSRGGSSEEGSSQGGNSGEASSSVSPSSSSEDDGDDVWTPVPLQSEITKAQPMTGLVLWADNSKASSYANSIALEYAYRRPSEVVRGKKADGSIDYDWSSFESLLDAVAGRGHQAIVRFIYEYPENEDVDPRKPGSTAVPAYIKALSDYNETYNGSCDDCPTYYADWSNSELQWFTRQFYADFAAKYDNDPRLAFLEVGFGHWGEYHIYDTDIRLGTNFPSKDYQRAFLRHLDTLFKSLPWAISIDAADDDYTPIVASTELMGLDFGLFDDSFMHEGHERSSGDGYNEDNWIALDYANRWKRTVMGGEVSYYTSSDQTNFLKPSGMYGVTWEQMAAKYHVSFMIANDAPDGSYGTKDRFLEASLASGYKFRVTSFERTDAKARVTIVNEGVAPLYRDAWVAVNGTRGGASLKGLLPGDSLTATIRATGDLELAIESDNTVSGRSIGYLADLR